MFIFTKYRIDYKDNILKSSQRSTITFGAGDSRRPLELTTTVSPFPSISVNGRESFSATTETLAGELSKGGKVKV